MTRPRPTSLLPLLLVASACAPDVPSGPPLATVRDSAGITIVENPTPEQTPRLPWSVSAEPTVTVGSLDGPEEYQLYQVRNALRLDDGRILVANSGSAEVRSYDGSGVHLASWGGQGEGPGEFMQTTRMKAWPSGDSIAVWDQRLGRLTIMGTDGSFGRTVKPPDFEGVGFPTFFDALPDGRMVLLGTEFTGTESGTTRLPMTFALADAEGTLLSTLGTFPGPETVLQISESSVQIISVPFARDNVVARVGGSMVIASNDRFELPFYAPDGGLRRLVRADGSPRPVTDALRSAEIERRVGNLAEQAQPGYRANLESLEFPPTLPVFTEILWDATGNIWVRLYRPPTEPGPTAWVVLDGSGQIMGRIETPEGLDVFQIGEDFILGSMEDEFEVEQVQLWSLSR